MAGVDGGDLFTSSDSGATWVDRAAAGSRRWFSTISNSDGSEITVADLGGNIWSSVDSGATWTNLASEGMHNWTAMSSNGIGRTLVVATLDAGLFSITLGGSSLPPPIPDPEQQSKITPALVLTGVGNSSNEVVITGSFIEKISAIQIDGGTVVVSTWVNSPTSLSFTLPALAPGVHSIQIYDGSAPVMIMQSIVLSVPLAVALPVLPPKVKVTYIRCTTPGHGLRIVYGKNPQCPVGAIKG